MYSLNYWKLKILTVLSSEPEMTMWPSGLRAMLCTPCVCPVLVLMHTPACCGSALRVCTTTQQMLSLMYHPPVRRSQQRTAPSRQAVKTIALVGWHLMSTTAYTTRISEISIWQPMPRGSRCPAAVEGAQQPGPTSG